MNSKLIYISAFFIFFIPSIFFGQKKSALLKKQEKNLIEKINHTKDLIKLILLTNRLIIVKSLLIIIIFS